MFRSDGTALKFDPVCRDFNLDTVISDSACAARVEAGEPAPSLAIAAQTIEQVPTRAADAINVLERSANASNHAAVHYFLGIVLSSPSILKPDYKAAVEHLAMAAEKDNSAAAYKLAILIFEGKGTRRDMPRVITLLETAAAGGVPVAAVSLGKLYLSGRFLSINKLQGSAWLDAAVGFADPEAWRLSVAAKLDLNMNNIQLIPAPSVSDVRVMRFNTFENPFLPPNFGLDPAFQKIYDSEFDDPSTRAALLANEKSNPTPYLYELARRIAPYYPEKATKSYLIAKMRMTYDAARCLGPAAFGALQAWDTFVLPEIRFLFSN
jgi:hypothetical protein